MSAVADLNYNDCEKLMKRALQERSGKTKKVKTEDIRLRQQGNHIVSLFESLVIVTTKAKGLLYYEPH